MQLDIDKLRNNFFKKCLSVGHHNVKYTWMQIMLMILSCIRGLESFEEGAKGPSAQTLRDRLRLEGGWLLQFHDTMWRIAQQTRKVFPRYRWWISIDETHIPFFGKKDALNRELLAKGLGRLVHGYRAKTPGATGSFCFLVISLCCCRLRIPIAVKMMAVGEHYKPWLKPQLERLLKLAPRSRVLADRGFGAKTWFFIMLDELGVRYVVRIPLRKKENKNKVANGSSRFQYWMKEADTNESVLLTVHVARDKQDREYILASNIEHTTGKELLGMYLNRWDLENIFKDSDRVELPTSSRNPNMRLFCVVASFLIFTLWQIRPLVEKVSSSLRTFVKQMIAVLCKLLQCIITPIGVMFQAPT